MLRLRLLLLFGTCVVEHTAHEKLHAARGALCWPKCTLRVVLARVHAARCAGASGFRKFFGPRVQGAPHFQLRGGWTRKYDENIHHHTVDLRRSGTNYFTVSMFVFTYVSIERFCILYLISLHFTYGCIVHGSISPTAFRGLLNTASCCAGTNTK